MRKVKKLILIKLPNKPLLLKQDLYLMLVAKLAMQKLLLKVPVIMTNVKVRKENCFIIITVMKVYGNLMEVVF